MNEENKREASTTKHKIQGTRANEVSSECQQIRLKSLYLFKSIGHDICLRIALKFEIYRAYSNELPSAYN